MTTFRVVAASILLGTTMAIATLFVPISVPNRMALERVEMGLPFPFVHQNLSRYEPESWPQTFSFNAPQEHATAISFECFGLDVAIFSSLVAAALYVVRRVRISKH
jgi:hypothetical protein